MLHAGGMVMQRDRMLIRVCEPTIGELEKEYVLRCLDNNWLSSIAPIVRQFERQFAEYIGVKHAISVCSGGAALFLSLKVLAEDTSCGEVIMPTFTMIATANMVREAGFDPVFVDSEWDTGNINPELIEGKITPKTRAILPVHIYGHPCDMDSIMEIARKHNLYVIEDAAEAHGAEYESKKCGSIGDFGCFSFYANKIITTGNGGMITTNNDDWADKIRRMKMYYFSDESHFWHERIGYALEMAALQAAVGMAQLEKIDSLVGSRRRNAEFYMGELYGLPVEFPVERERCKCAYWMFGLRVRDRATRDALMKYLEERGIETRTFFFPMHWQPLYKEDGHYPVADKLGERGLYLPSSSHLSDEAKKYVCGAIREHFRVAARTGRRMEAADLQL